MPPLRVGILVGVSPSNRCMLVVLYRVRFPLPPPAFSSPPQTRSSRHEVKLWDGMGMSRGPVVTWEQATRGRFNHAGSRVRGWRLLPLLRGKDGAWGEAVTAGLSSDLGAGGRPFCS